MIWLRNWLLATYYLRIGPERIEIRDVDRGTTLDEVAAIAIGPDARGRKQVVAVGRAALEAARASSGVELHYPFRHPRVPFGDYTVAEKLIQHVVQTFVRSNGRPRPMTRMVVHPLHRLEGGLTQIEHRAFQELVANAGARHVVIHEGAELLDWKIDDAFFKKIRD